jgi:hypothetical protein
MFKEHDQIVLTSDLPDEGLKSGDVGTIVHIHRQGEAFEVEFSALDGKTIAVATVLASQVRPVTDKDVVHARPMELPV